jgi:hypothetical protein
MPLLDLFWTMFMIFIFFAWIWLLIMIFADIFRSDISGVGKAVWVIFVIIVPVLGVLVYLIVHGDEMRARSMKQAVEMEQAQRQYIQQAAAGGSTASELEKLAGLHQQGVLSDEEFAAEKAKLLS